MHVMEQFTFTAWLTLKHTLKILLNKGLSFQAQSRDPIRTSIDQPGEQTIISDAKTSCGIKSFASNQESFLNGWRTVLIKLRIPKLLMKWLA